MSRERFDDNHNGQFEDGTDRRTLLKSMDVMVGITAGAGTGSAVASSSQGNSDDGDGDAPT